MKYVVMCGGSYEHWKEPRQLTPINGEPLVLRTIRLLREQGITDIAVSVSGKHGEELFKSCADAGVQLLSHKNTWVVHRPGHSSGYWCDAFFPTNEPTCYLMGDVVFSPEAIKTIVETETDDIEFFASAPPFAKNYMKRWAEPFAFKVVNTEHLRKAQEETRLLADKKKFRRPPIAWEFWQVVKGTQINKIDYTNYTVINDYTCDIDTQMDIDKFAKIPID